jgi:hypothetical protein
MNTLPRIGALALLVSSALASLASPAYADSAPLTREQVRDSVLQARRQGDLTTFGEASIPQRQLNPGLYPQRPEAPGRSRADVKAELLEAERNGDIATGEAGVPAYEQTPSAYPAHPKPQGRTRAEVKAELAEAIRNHEIRATYGP